MRILSLLCLVCLAVGSCSHVTVQESKATSPQVSTTAGAALDPACLTPPEVKATLQQMAEARSESEFNQIKALLVSDSQKSPSCRQSLITSVVQIMDRPLSEYENRAVQFNVWSAGANLLASVRASEALDFLIAHLDYSSGMFSTTMSQQPALRTVITIGEDAIPKLSEVLRQNPNASMRMYSVYCITAIGGPSAKKPLKEAVQTESDHCVKRFLEASIEALDNEEAFKRDNTKWFFAFMCDSSSPGN